MNHQKNIQYFMNLNYDALLKKVKENYLLFIPELSVIAEGKTPDDAYAQLTKEKGLYFKRMIDMNLQDVIKEPTVKQMRKEWTKDLILFASKSLILFLLVIVLSYSMLLPVLSSVDKFISRKLQEIPGQTLSKTIDKIDSKLSTMSNEEKDKMRGKLRSIARKLKPFIDEVKTEFDKKPTEWAPSIKEIQ